MGLSSKGRKERREEVKFFLSCSITVLFIIMKGTDEDQVGSTGKWKWAR